jgi:hypothetical protein
MIYHSLGSRGYITRGLLVRQKNYDISRNKFFLLISFLMKKWRNWCYRAGFAEHGPRTKFGLRSLILWLGVTLSLRDFFLLSLFLFLSQEKYLRIPFDRAWFFFLISQFRNSSSYFSIEFELMSSLLLCYFECINNDREEIRDLFYELE